MPTYLNMFLGKLRSVRVVAAFLAIVVAFTVSSSSVAGAAPSYFNVDKPSSTSNCTGTTTTYEWHWVWGRGNSHGHGGGWGWLWSWFGHFERVAVQTPNWEKNGFNSKAQCLRYVTTAAPETRADCRNRGWFRLGFKSQGQCIRYLNLNGGGYGGNV